MRVIALFLILTSLIYSEGFPKIFSSAGDDVYADMEKYIKIKNLEIYADRPEFLESFCSDANTSMQTGFALDKMQEDPEMTIDKSAIKSYARELRRLASQNEAIRYQLRVDIEKLYEAKDLVSLIVFKNSDIELNQEIIEAIAKDEKQRKHERSLAIVIAKSKVAKKIETFDSNKTKATPSAEKLIKKPEAIEAPKPIEIVPLPLADTVSSAPMQTNTTKIVKAPEKKKVLTKLEYYEENLMRLKEELYTLRESGDQEKMACLNDITAINYWMISLLKNERDSCAVSDAIKQMKSYDKSSVHSCGRDSIRYMEWHGRIKPYSGTKLFQAEAACNR